MQWEVAVRGPESVLEELTHALQSSPNTIIRSKDGFVLLGDTFAGLRSEAEVRLEAQRVVEALSGICRMLLQSDTALSIASIAEVRPDGTRNIFVQLEPGVLSITGGLVSLRVTRSDGSVEERRPSDPALAWLTKALETPEAARALRLRDKRSLSWTDLYRLFEVIVDGAGGTDTIVNAGWASRTQLSRFKHSANSVSVAGDEARHGVESTMPPSDAMTMSEARSLVDILLARWLGVLANTNWSRRRCGVSAPRLSCSVMPLGRPLVLDVNGSTLRFMESVPLTREQAIASLVEAEADIRALGVARLALFGSVLRNEARPDSDVDLLVQFALGRKSYASFLALSDLLEARLTRRVELVTTEALSPFLGPRILAEAQDVLRAA